jgi:hypothetical protein
MEVLSDGTAAYHRASLVKRCVSIKWEDGTDLFSSPAAGWIPDQVRDDGSGKEICFNQEIASRHRFFSLEIGSQRVADHGVEIQAPASREEHGAPVQFASRAHV